MTARQSTYTEAEIELLKAVLTVLKSRGPDGVTVDEVATAHGVSRSWIQHHFPDRGQLLAAALAQTDLGPYTPPGETIRDQVAVALRQLRVGTEEIIGRRAYATLTGGTDADFARAFRAQVIRPRLAAVTALLTEAAACGQLRADLDYRSVTHMLAGAFFAALVVDGTAPTGWPDDAIDLIWTALAKPATT